MSNDTSYLFSKVTMGGTFNAFHVGHQRYLEIGCRIARQVVVHVTTDAFATVLKPYRIRPYSERAERVIAFIKQKGFSERVEIRPLDSNEQVRDFCLDSLPSVAVVEPAYLALFQDINIELRLRKLDEMCILIKPRTVISGVELSSRNVEAD
jgi:cytidyltransferase-like protein